MKINYLKIDIAFDGLRKFLKEIKSGELLTKFYGQYDDPNGYFPYLKFNRSEMSVSFEEQISNEDWRTKTDTFQEYTITQLIKLVKKLKIDVSNIIVRAPTHEMVLDYQSQFHEEMEKLRIQINSLDNEKLRIEIIKDLPVFSFRGSVNRIETINILQTEPKSSTQVDQTHNELLQSNFVSEYFGDKKVTQTLWQLLVENPGSISSKKYISKVSIKDFRMTFTPESSIAKPVKLNWIADHAEFRFFLKEMERIFEFRLEHKEMYKIANGCFNFHENPYEFYPSYNKGHDPKVTTKKRQRITEILTTAKAQFRPKAKPKEKFINASK